MNILSLDVSIGHSYYIFYQDKISLLEGNFNHNPLDFSAILKHINKFFSIPNIIFESTGIDSKVFEPLYQDNGVEYYLLNLLETKKQTEENTLRSCKTD